MQDAKEQPPPGSLPEDIIKMSKYKSASDENPRDVFWNIVEARKEGEGFAEKVSKYAGIREALVNIGCSVLEEEPRGYRVKVSRGFIADCLLAMVVEGKWEDSLERILSNLYERKKGPEPSMLAAFGKAFAENGELLGGWLKALLGGERPSEEVLAYVLHSGERGIVESLRAELLNIARTEINEPQVFAMMALGALLPEDADVRKVFVDMMDDWDAETKKAALGVLGGVGVPEAGRKAVALYAHEPEAACREALEMIVAKNKAECRGEFGKLVFQLGGKERDALVELAVKVYGKKGAEEVLIGEGAGRGGGAGKREGTKEAGGVGGGGRVKTLAEMQKGKGIGGEGENDEVGGSRGGTGNTGQGTGGAGEEGGTAGGAGIAGRMRRGLSLGRTKGIAGAAEAETGEEDGEGAGGGTGEEG